jgi:hypothetical protein
MTVGALFRSVDGASVPPEAAGVRVRHLTDRSDDAGPGSLYFAVPGTKVDGHDFLPDVVKAGAAGAVVEHPVELPGAGKRPAAHPGSDGSPCARGGGCDVVRLPGRTARAGGYHRHHREDVGAEHARRHPGRGRRPGGEHRLAGREDRAGLRGDRIHRARRPATAGSARRHRGRRLSARGHGSHNPRAGPVPGPRGPLRPRRLHESRAPRAHGVPRLLPALRGGEEPLLRPSEAGGAGRAFRRRPGGASAGPHPGHYADPLRSQPLGCGSHRAAADGRGRHPLRARLPASPAPPPRRPVAPHLRRHEASRPGPGQRDERRPGRDRVGMPRGSAGSGCARAGAHRGRPPPHAARPPGPLLGARRHRGTPGKRLGGVRGGGVAGSPTHPRSGVLYGGCGGGG